MRVLCSMSFKPVDVLQSKSLIEMCIQDVQQWMVVNKLKLNGDKSELLVLTARHRPPPPLDSILIGADIIEASKSAKTLVFGLIMCFLWMYKLIISVKLLFSTFVT